MFGGKEVDKQAEKKAATAEVSIGFPLLKL